MKLPRRKEGKQNEMQAPKFMAPKSEPATPVAATAEPTVHKVFITPEIASGFMERSDLNRTLNRNRAVLLAEAFQRGEHRLTGDAIIFNKRSLMTNGQHRMLAVMLAGLDRGLPFWVMENADDDEILVQDTGRPRSFLDHLKMSGVTNRNAMAGAAKLLLNYRNGVVASQTLWEKRLSPTNFQMDAFFKENEAILRDGTHHADQVRRRLQLGISALAVAWIVISAIDREDAEAFWDELMLKTDEVSSAVRVLINVVLNTRKARRGLKGREAGWYSPFDTRHQLALIFKTWNSWRDGREVKNLSFKTGGKAPEQFPVPR